MVSATLKLATASRGGSRAQRTGLFYNGKLELNQGAYLTEAPPKLLSALDAAYVTNTGRHITGLSVAEPGASLGTEENAGLGEAEEPKNGRRFWVYFPGQRAFK